MKRNAYFASLFLSYIFAVIALGGCTSEGQPVVHGTFASTDPSLALPSQVGVTWYWETCLSTGGFRTPGEDVEVDPGGSFSLPLDASNLARVVGRGPEDAIFGSLVAVGFISGLANSVGWTNDEKAVVYVSQDVHEDTLAAHLLGATPNAGYYVADVVRQTPQERESIRACRASAGVPAPPEAENWLQAYQRELALTKACGRLADRLVLRNGGFIEPIALTPAGGERDDRPIQLAQELEEGCLTFDLM